MQVIFEFESTGTVQRNRVFIFPFTGGLELLGKHSKEAKFMGRLLLNACSPWHKTIKIEDAIEV